MVEYSIFVPVNAGRTPNWEEKAEERNGPRVIGTL